MTADLDLIRRAANQMRELAEAAIASSSDNVPEWHSVRSLMGEGKTEGDAEHIAKWDPETAQAVARLLFKIAAAHDLGLCVCDTDHEALAVARAFLKEDADV